MYKLIVVWIYVDGRASVTGGNWWPYLWSPTGWNTLHTRWGRRQQADKQTKTIQRQNTCSVPQPPQWCRPTMPSRWAWSQDYSTQRRHLHMNDAITKPKPNPYYALNMQNRSPPHPPPREQWAVGRGIIVLAIGRRYIFEREEGSRKQGRAARSEKTVSARLPTSLKLKLRIHT